MFFRWLDIEICKLTEEALPADSKRFQTDVAINNIAHFIAEFDEKKEDSAEPNSPRTQSNYKQLNVILDMRI